MRTHRITATFVLMCGFTGLSARVCAQDRSAVEVAGFFGGSGLLPSVSDPIRQGLDLGLSLAGVRNARITESDRASFKWLAGGGVAVPVSDNLFVVGELAYNRVGRTNFQIAIPGRPTASASFQVDFMDFTGGVQYQFGTADSRVAPYVGGGVGIVRASASGSSSVLPSAITTTENDLSANGGGGLRLFIGKSWGLRPEVKVVRVPDETYMRASVGLFYQFGR